MARSDALRSVGGQVLRGSCWIGSSHAARINVVLFRIKRVKPHRDTADNVFDVMCPHGEHKNGWMCVPELRCQRILPRPDNILLLSGKELDHFFKRPPDHMTRKTIGFHNQYKPTCNLDLRIEAELFDLACRRLQMAYQKWRRQTEDMVQVIYL